MKTNTNFMSNLKQTIANNNTILTENGAVGLSTTGKYLLDMNFKLSSMRNWSDVNIISAYMDAFSENKELAIKFLFFARDIRGGIGERRFFRVVFDYLMKHHIEDIEKYIPLVPEYGRWDDLLCAIDNGAVVELIEKQLVSDITNLKNGDSVSLLAKWLPSNNTSSHKSVSAARKIARALGVSDKEYRKMLTALRNKINIVESQMSRNKWDGIDYEAVPSKANILYKNAFVKHDSTRRLAYLESLKSGKAKINSSAAFPYDIVKSYGLRSTSEDQTLESMWKALPAPNVDFKPCIVVCDGSGSMYSHFFSECDKNKPYPITVASSLAIWFSEHLTGPYKDKMITFSEYPSYVDLSGCSSLREKINTVLSHNEVANTNIERVMDMVIETAVKNNVPAEKIPTVVIISDMEFDACTRSGDGPVCMNKTLFGNLSKKYEKIGYKLPKLVFWNVASRTGAIPLSSNDMGVVLVSGFSQNIADMVMSGNTDPYKILVDKLNEDRYNLDKQLKKITKIVPVELDQNDEINEDNIDEDDV